MERILKILLTITILLSLVSLNATAEDTSEHIVSASKHELEPEEYAVYSAMINAMYIHAHADGVFNQDVKLIVIKETTMWKGAMGSIPKRVRESLKLDHAIIDDYWTGNSLPCKLSANSFNLEADCVLISEKEEDEIFSRRLSDGEKEEQVYRPEIELWHDFYKKFPNSQGIMTLSTVGFNRDRTKAFVSVYNVSQVRFATEHYVLLSKENGKWIVKKVDLPDMLP